MSQQSRSTLVRLGTGILLSVVGGLALVLAFPPYGIWPLALVGLVPILVAQLRVMPPKWSSLASALGLGVWLQGYLGPVFAPIGTYMVWLPLIVAVFTFITDRGLRDFDAQTSYRWFVVSGTLNWAGVEMIRLFIPIAGTWAFIAYPFYRQVWLIQPVSVFGIIGMGMLVILINHVVTLLVLRWIDGRWRLDADTVPVNAGLARRWTWIGGAVAGCWVVLSLVLLNLPLHTPQVTVAAIQPNAGSLWYATPEEREEMLPKLHARMVEQSRDAAAQGAQFIVWPEGSLPWDPQVEDRLQLRELARDTGAHLAVGYLLFEDRGMRNEATVINPQGDFLGVFGKDHPVVFGGETSLTRGTYPVYQTPIGTLGTIICYDLDYTDTVRKLVRRGAQLIGVPSNDWSTIADKHYTHVVFRAVENRVAMVKADGGWDSAIIDPYGRIQGLARFPQGGEATLVAEVPLGSGRPTLNARLGDWTGWIGLAGLVFFAIGGGWLKSKSGGGSRHPLNHVSQEEER